MTSPRRCEETGSNEDQGYATRFRPRPITRASRCENGIGVAGGKRGRRARAVPERPRSFLSYPENRSLRHAASNHTRRGGGGHACTADHRRTLYAPSAPFQFFLSAGPRVTGVA